MLQTERLTIRPPSLEDAHFFLELLNDPAWIKYIGNPQVHDLRTARDYLQNKFLDVYQLHGYCLFPVVLNSNQEIMGICGLVNREELEHVDLGYAFLPEFRGQGYAFEAAQAVMKFAKESLDLKYLQAVTLPTNAPSITLLNKLKFRFEKSITWSNEEVLSVFKTKL